MGVHQLLAGLGGGAAAESAGSGTITYQSQNYGNNGGGGSVSLSLPASVAAGDLIVVFLGQKPQTANGGGATTPTGYTLLTSLTGAGGYGATLGTDTGNTNVYVWYRIATGSDTCATTLSDSNCYNYTTFRLSKSAGTWNVAGTTGQDTTTGNLSISYTDPLFTFGGDFILVYQVIPTVQNSGAQYSSPSIVHTGATIGAITERQAYGYGSSNHVAGCAWSAPVSSGAGTGTPSFSATVVAGTQSNAMGANAIVRIRAV